MYSGEKALIFDIQRYCIHDGPGIRTVIFFKGCNLNCDWCQNPEGKEILPELTYYSSRCNNLGACLSACDKRAIIKQKFGVKIDYELCTICGDCVDACPTNAMVITGKYYTVDELLDVCSADEPYYNRSSGGITLSGGEPVLHYKFLKNFLPKAKFHVLLETAGNFRWENLLLILPHINHIYYDVKIATEKLHKQYTGSSNHHILINLKKLVEMKFPLTVRVPQVPDINTSEQEVKAIADVLNEIGVKKIKLMQYNHLWEDKIDNLCTKQIRLNKKDNDLDYFQIVKWYKSHGIISEISGD